ncbi:ROK family protein [Paenibacillus sp. ACRRY]|uniref:ROK family protein n=1 Tax=Paenibacillus sp. ACRRY TaxID=2918208 RepID=UPI001EF70643|nr:ROK family protein [Paenibacillus sp. ACRRY]MCG7381999.1 ROK family protein [Paenibacillus sp. ACRRY]
MMSNMITNNTMRVKKMNQELVRQTLKKLKQGTKSRVAEATGLSVATCRSILIELLEAGELVELDMEESNGGRPAQIYKFNENFSYIACLIVKAGVKFHSILFTVNNLYGETVEEGYREIQKDQMNEGIIYEIIDSLLRRFPLIRAVGIGVPGAVHQGVVNVSDIPRLVGVPLGAFIREKYEVEVVVENDMNLTVYGLYQKREYQDENSIVVATFIEGSLPGAGIMIDGHIHRGNTQFAGEIAFLPLGLSHDEQFRLLHNRDTFHTLAARSVSSLIAVMNPETLALTGTLVQPEDVKIIRKECLKYIPEMHMPQMRLLNDPDEDYMFGLLSMTLESLSYSLQLVEKRI